MQLSLHEYQVYIIHKFVSTEYLKPVKLEVFRHCLILLVCER